MKWRWRPVPRKKLVAERREAEAKAARVHWEVIRPLREMRARNHLTDAVIADIRKRLKESGG